jgi:hypothetical protein
VLSYRASLTFVLFAVLATSTAFASRVHRAPAGSHAAAHPTHKTTSKGAAKGARTSSEGSAKGTRASSKGSSKRSSRRSTKDVAAASKSHKLHGQQAIDPSRVTEIQQALIREHYLDGEATGRWDATTEGAMQKYQADQGWQTKLMPDSRALKKLGLGPDYSGAINAKNSSFAAPPPVGTIPPPQSAGFAEAAGVNR